MDAPFSQLIAAIVAAALLLLVVVARLLGRTIVVQEGEAVVTEALGRFRRVLGPGLHRLRPGERPKVIDWTFPETWVGKKPEPHSRKLHRIDLREIVLACNAENVVTADGVIVDKIVAFLAVQITDPRAAVYSVANLETAIVSLTQASLRRAVSQLGFEDALKSRDALFSQLTALTTESCAGWGVRINRVELEFVLTGALRKAVEQKRARILDMEAIQEVELRRAQLESTVQRMKIEAESDALARLSLAPIFEKGDPAAYLIALRYIDAIKELGPGDKGAALFHPADALKVLKQARSAPENDKVGT